MITASTQCEASNRLQIALEVLTEDGFSFYITQCSFLKTSVQYLGKKNCQKIVALTALSPTQSVTSLRQFIVLTTYFKQCIKGFSQLMKPYYILYLFIFNNLRQK